MVQWLGFSASITIGMGSIPGWEIKIPQPHSKAKNKQNLKEKQGGRLKLVLTVRWELVKRGERGGGGKETLALRPGRHSVYVEGKHGGRVGRQGGVAISSGL